ncbi:MAG: MMPL family transporter [Planctomycetota bacterium]|nr:MMPL family transporter [Planctomycetota bacterium]
MTPYRTLILKGWWIILLVLFAWAIGVGQYMFDIDVDAGTDVLVGDKDPDLAYYERTRPLWGYDEYAMVAMVRDDWITPDGVALQKQIVKALEAVPHVEGVVSILDVPLLRQQDGPLFDPANVPTLKSEGIDYDRARAEIVEHTQARGNLISTDGRSLGLLVFLAIPEAMRTFDKEWAALKNTPDPTPEQAKRLAELDALLDVASDELAVRRTAMVDGLRETVKRLEPKLDEPVRLSGLPFINISIEEHLNHDIEVFGIAALVLFTLGFLLVYLRPRFVVLPILTCLLPVVIVIGTMALRGDVLTVVTANLPVLLFTLMLPYTVYFVERYRERRSLYPEESGDQSSIEAAKSIFLPCLFSCTTTMAGFLALVTSTTKPVRTFGLMTSVGMGVGLIVVFLAIPSMSRPLSPMRIPASGVQTGTRGLVRLFERVSLRMPAAIVALSLVVLGLAMWGTTKLSAQSKFTEYFMEDSAVYQGLEYIDQEMGGTTPLEVIVTAKDDLYFLKPEGIQALEAVQAYFDTVPEVGNVRSIATLVDEIKKKNPNIVPMMPFFGKHPMVRSVTKEYADEAYKTSRVLVRFRETAPTLDRNVILDGLRAHLESAPELQDLEVRETGVFLLYANMLNSLMDTQRKTFIWVVVAIFVMLIILFWSPILAILMLLTQVLPAVVMLGVMGWLGIPLDVITVMIAAIAMGIGIDAAIQYTDRFRRELAVDGDHRAALSRAHATIGRAIWIATSVIIVGFCVLMLSQFRPSIYFGLFTAIAMLMSQLAALTVLPSIFLLTGYPKRPKQPKRSQDTADDDDLPAFYPSS